MSYLKKLLFSLAVIPTIVLTSVTTTTKTNVEPVEETPQVVVEEVKEPVRKNNYTREEILSMIDYYADKYGVSRELANFVAKNESGYRADAVGDLHLTCRASKSPHNGDIVYARGIYQITRCFHYTVTDEQAFDAKFNIEYGIRLMRTKESCMQQFTECRNYYLQKN